MPFIIIGIVIVLAIVIWVISTINSFTLLIRSMDLFEVNGASSTEELQKHIEGDVHLLGYILETLQIPNLHQ